jgi:hypothetical protein
VYKILIREVIRRFSVELYHHTAAISHACTKAGLLRGNLPDVRL